MLILIIHFDLYPQQLIGKYYYGSNESLIFLTDNIVKFHIRSLGCITYELEGQGKYKIKKGKLNIYPYESYEAQNHKYFILQKNLDSSITIINIEVKNEFNPIPNATICLLDSNKQVLFQTTSDSNGQVILKFNSNADFIKISSEHIFPYKTHTIPYKQIIGKSIRVYLEEGFLMESGTISRGIKLINENEFQLLGNREKKWIIINKNFKRNFNLPWDYRIKRNINKQTIKKFQK